jgi:hypothetical protein
MMMHDFVTAAERLTFKTVLLHDFYFHECTGCGRTSEEIVNEDECTYESLEWNSKTTNSGLWYCHDDCYRDSH